MKVEYGEGSVALRWLITLCEVILVAVSLLMVFALFRRFFPNGGICEHELKWYCSLASASYIVVSAYTQPVVLRSLVRSDEIMQACFRKVALLFVLLCAVLTFVGSVSVAHCLLAAFSVVLFFFLFLEEMAARFCLRLTRWRWCAASSAYEASDQEWFTVKLAYSDEPLRKVFNRYVKRLSDICLSSFLLLTLFPVAYVCMFCITKLKRRRAVLITETLSGMDGKLFRCLLFRCGGGKLKKMPMLINVLAGNMSLVGSAMCASSYRDEYRRLLEDNVVHRPVKPGITSWYRTSDICGGYMQVGDCVKYDVWYVRNWTFWLDVCVILKTMLTREKSNIVHD